MEQLYPQFGCCGCYAVLVVLLFLIGFPFRYRDYTDDDGAEQNQDGESPTRT